MANLNIRKLDNHIYERLRVRAANHGVSMEEEARQILSVAISVPERMTDIFQKNFGYKQGVDLKLPHERAPHHPMDFDRRYWPR